MKRSFTMATDAEEMLVTQLVHTWWKSTPGDGKEVVDDHMPPRFKGTYSLKDSAGDVKVDVHVEVTVIGSLTQVKLVMDMYASAEVSADDVIYAAAEWFVLELEKRDFHVTPSEEGDND